MAQTQRDQLITWLKDAYAMERFLIPIAEHHAQDAARYPALKQRIEQHLQEGYRQVERLNACLVRLGGSPPGAMASAAGALGGVGGWLTGPAQDEVVKNSLLDYASEQLEVGAYRALIVAAEEVGDQETARVCEEILREEQAMAVWLLQYLPQLIQETQQESAKGLA